mgnify:CR=1 FL=1
MKEAELLSYYRDPLHDYSAPGTYHLFLETEDAARILGSMRKGMMTLNACGEVFLDTLGMTLHRFACVRIRSMDMKPHYVEMVVEITEWRRKLTAERKDKALWIIDRRGMTIPLFVGCIKMNSGLRINRLRKMQDVAVWTEKYKVRLMTDEAEIAEVCARLDAGFAQVRLAMEKATSKMKKSKKLKKKATKNDSPVSGSLTSLLASALGGFCSEGAGSVTYPGGPVSGMDTMLLGRALFLSGSLLRPAPSKGVLPERGPGARACRGGPAQVPLICSIGPGRIVVSGSTAV